MRVHAYRQLFSYILCRYYSCMHVYVCMNFVYLLLTVYMDANVWMGVYLYGKIDEPGINTFITTAFNRKLMIGAHSFVASS